MLFRCWTTVYDAVTTLFQHRIIILCLILFILNPVVRHTNPVICNLAYNVKYNNANGETEDDLIDDAVYKLAPIKPTWKSETGCMFKHELSHKHQN